MEQIDPKEIRDFYNEVSEIWPNDSPWFVYTREQIEIFLNDNRAPDDSYILNAGSAGNTYGLPYSFHHVDIAENHLIGLSNATVASIESMPFKSNTFDGCICVGSVINYCCAMTAICELLRVIKPGGTLILEFESSNSYEYRHSEIYGSAAAIATLTYRQKKHRQWLYSYRYIKDICVACGAEVEAAKYFHILSSYKLGSGLDEDAASLYAQYDKQLSIIPFIKQHASNIILRCKKL